MVQNPHRSTVLHPVLNAGRPAVYLVAGLVLGGSSARGLVAAGVAAVFFVVWMVLPRRWTRGALAPEDQE